MIKLIGQPAIANFLGQLYLLVMGVDGAVYNISQIAPSNGWTGWSSLGAPPNVSFVGSPAAFDSPDEVNLACRAVGNDGVLFQRDQGPQWGQWFSQITPAGTVPSGSPGIEGRNTFVMDTHGAAWAFNDTGGAGWSTLGAPPGGAVTTGKPAVAPSADGRLEVFVVGADGNLYHTWQTFPNYAWANWYSHGGSFTSTLALGASGDGRLELFVVGTDGALHHIWQTAHSNGWSGWYSHGTP